MSKINDFLKNSESDVEELINLELREQKKYDLPEAGCRTYNFKCAMAGLGFLFGTLTISSILSSYTLERKTRNIKQINEKDDVLKEKKDLSNISTFKPNQFYFAQTNFTNSLYRNNDLKKIYL